MAVTVIQCVIEVLGTIPEGLVKELEDLELRGQVTIILTIALGSANLLKRVLEACYHSNSSRKPTNASVKNS